MAESVFAELYVETTRRGKACLNAILGLMRPRFLGELRWNNGIIVVLKVYGRLWGFFYFGYDLEVLTKI